MSILDRYIGLRIVAGCALVWIVLAALLGLIDFAEELGHSGQGNGNYTALDAALFSGLTLAGRMLDLAPTIVLLGTTLALAALGRNSELVAMQAGGVSQGRMALAIAKVALLFVLAILVLEQVIVPSVDRYAYMGRAMKTNKSPLQSVKNGLWSIRGGQWINVRRPRRGQWVGDMDLYTFDEAGELRVFTTTHDLFMDEQGRPWFGEVRTKAFPGRELTERERVATTWDLGLTTVQRKLLLVPLESLSPMELREYGAELHRGGIEAKQVYLLFWKKLAVAMASFSMMLLPLPLLYGALQQTGIYRRIAVATIAGIGFFLGNQIAIYLGMIFYMDPVITALSPVGVLVFVTGLIYSFPLLKSSRLVLARGAPCKLVAK